MKTSWKKYLLIGLALPVLMASASCDAESGLSSPQDQQFAADMAPMMMDLSVDERQEVRDVFQSYMPEIKAVRDEMKDDFQAVMDSVYNDVIVYLTDEQVSELDELKALHEERMAAFSEDLDSADSPFRRFRNREDCADFDEDSMPEGKPFHYFGTNENCPDFDEAGGPFGRIADELELADTQIEEIKAVFELYKPELTALREEMALKIEPIVDSAKAELSGILTDEQLEKIDAHFLNHKPGFLMID